MSDVKFSDFIVNSGPLDGTEKVVGISSVPENQSYGTNVLREYITRERGVLKSKTSLSSANILSLGTSQITLVAAQGANKIIVPVGFLFMYTAGSAGYATNTQMKVILGSLQFLLETQVLTNTGDYFKIAPSVSAVLSGSADFINVPLKLGTNGNGNPTTGDGSLIVITSYVVTDVS